MNCYPFHVEFSLYSENIFIESNCNAITFSNTGNVNVIINGYSLVPGATLVVQGNFGEMDTTTYNLIFTGGNGQCTVIRKFYN